VIIVAHRMPASSAAAAALARAGAAIFELDVRLPAGGPAVVTHFGQLGPGSARLYNDGWRVRRARSWSRLGPPLAEAIAVLPPECEVLLDVKGPVIDAEAAARAVVAGVPQPERTHLCGNVGPVARAVGALGIRVWRSVGSPTELDSALHSPGPAPWAFTVRHTMLSTEVLGALRRRAPRVMAWTVNSVDRALVLQSLGVDGITTDRPSVMTALRAASG